jgi:acyl-CoA reductase-like NAD-dependent aldehyde dehydrogenase
MTKLLRSLLQSKHPSAPSSSTAITLINPANALPHSHYHPSSSSELTHIVQTSLEAQKQWKRSPPDERSIILRRAADILSQNTSHVTRLETLDTGRPVRETQFDVSEAIECLHYYSGQIVHSHDLTYHYKTGRGYARRIPLGVTLGIGAWNYPLQSVLWKGVAALVYGNSMIYKPSEFTPSSALWMEGCLVEAGLPEGVFQVSEG